MSLPLALAPLIRRDRWVAWRLRRGAKLPYQPSHPRSYASTTDEATWGSYEQAVRAAERIGGGVGYVIGDGIAALDLDDCRDADTGVLARWARALIGEADSYTEVTPSRGGVRIIGFAHGNYVHRVLRRSPGKLEVYRDCARYITVTGEQIETAGLSNIDHVIDELIPDRVVMRAEAVVIDGTQEDPVAIIRRYARSLRLTVERSVPVGKRSDVIWRIGMTLKDRGATPGEVAQVLRSARCWADKHGQNERALFREVRRMFR